MDRREWGRVGGAVAMAVVAMVGCDLVANLLVPSSYPVRPGYAVPGVAEPAVNLAALQRSWPAGMSEPGSRPRLIGYMSRIERAATPTLAAPEAPAPPERDLGVRLAAGNVEKGRQTAQICGTCHSLDRDGPNRIGPDLWGVVGRNVASHPGFSYSSAMKSQSGNWTYERLDHFLAGPGRAVPGTKMTFMGIRDPEARASVLAYLSTLNTSPPPFPPPHAQPEQGMAQHAKSAQTPSS
ncbi:MAG TPA: cytochrome c family protein [Acetobacteraceae bacterium]|nr:cytochrome c family protein [Acetobacteraceae bacterium]